MYGKIYLVNKNTRSLVAISIRGGNSATLFWHCFTQKSIYFVSWTHRTQATLLLPAWHESFYTSSPVNKHGQSCMVQLTPRHNTSLSSKNADCCMVDSFCWSSPDLEKIYSSQIYPIEILIGASYASMIYRLFSVAGPIWNNNLTVEKNCSLRHLKPAL